jgi:hypothetical protein
VEYAEPDYVVRADFIPNDPLFAMNQADLTLTGVPVAWNATTGSSSMIAAVLDTGLALAHPDLTAQWMYASGHSANQHVFLSAPASSCPAATTPDDDRYLNTGNPLTHGTHVSGTIAAGFNNGAGVAGIAGGVRVLPLKVLDCTGTGQFSDIANAITFAANNGARLVNLSLGANLSSGCPQSVQDVIDAAFNAGVFVAAAAGNSGSPDASYPAGCDHVVSVGATDNGDNVAAFSQHPPSQVNGVDLAAPGVNIMSTVRETNGAYAYDVASGTSMATPHVVGCAALVRSVSPALGPAEVESILKASAVDLGASGWDAYAGFGRIDCAAAVALAGAQGGVPTATASASSTSTPVSPTPTPGRPTATDTTRTSTPAATSTPEGSPPQTITFDDLASPNRVLNGQYPSGLVDWGTGLWWLSSPWGQFTTNSLSFNGGGPTSEPVVFLSPRRLVQLDAFNGGLIASSITLSCTGQPAVQVSVAPNQRTTIATNWTGTCSTVTVGSSNGWDTNFDSLVVAAAGGPPPATGIPTNTPVPQPSSAATPTPVPSATATQTPSATATPIPPTSTATAMPVSGSTTLTFNDLTNPNRVLSGQYPNGVIDWGTNGWYLSSPWRQFTTFSISFNGPARTSASFTFLGARRFVQMDAFNGGADASTILLNCAGQPTVQVALAANQLRTIQTGWTGPCTTVTVSNTNGWYTNFDNLVFASS